MVLVLNELSYSFEWPENQAKSLYNVFFKVCIDLGKETKHKTDLKYSKNKESEEIIFRNDPHFLQWFSLQKKEEKSLILSIITGNQFIMDYPYYKFNDGYGKGIGYAFENEELLLSFQSDDRWKVNFLNITEEQINDETEDIETNEIQIRNCHDNDSTKFHSEFLKNRLQSYNDSALIKIKKEVIKGQLLWKKKEILFPNLVFCNSTEAYIVNIQSGAKNGDSEPLTPG